MAYVDKVLLSGERIEQRPRYSRFAAYGAPLVEFTAVVFLWTLLRYVVVERMISAEFANSQWGMAIYVVGILAMAGRFGWRMCARFLNLAFSELAVTNRRYMEKAGVFDVTFWATDLEKIQRVEISQPLLGRVFDYGDLTIVTLGEVNHTTRAVAAPIRLQQAIHARMTQADLSSRAGSGLADERAAT
ncbi:MAG: PH domain-containing protein [Maricaulaceae bacterium]|jgi:uncharacterized membrane protein YdbT with pleckstrin-like domain